MTEGKYYLFNERGILRNRVEYKEDRGLPIAVSPNGLNFIFRNSKNSKSEGKDLLTLTLMRITE